MQWQGRPMILSHQMRLQGLGRMPRTQYRTIYISGARKFPNGYAELTQAFFRSLFSRCSAKLTTWRAAEYPILRVACTALAAPSIAFCTAAAASSSAVWGGGEGAS